MLQNLHTHTVMCDGKNTPEEMLDKAIELGFDSIGFSAHAKSSFQTSWELHAPVIEYVAKINDLKKVYEGRIKVFLGTELDYFSKGVMPTEGFDYTIGSVHSVIKNGIQVSFDHSYETAVVALKEFGGNSLEYAKAYYEQVVRMANEFDYDVVGHFDLLTKFSEKHPDFINVESVEYKRIALDALHQVRKTKEIFEVNTGAIGRGYRTTPYPAPFILDEMKRFDCKLILSSDCHNRDYLAANFNESIDYIRAHGFDTLYYLTENGFSGEKI